MATMATRARSATSEVDTGDIDQLNVLLRGEISAIETYQQALTKFEDQETVSTLSQIRDDHTQIVSTLRSLVIGAGVSSPASSGIWGSFAKAVTGTAKLIGPQTVLAALREGEEFGYSDYEKTLERTDVSERTKSLVRDDLIVRSQQHILTLNDLIDDYAQA